VLPDLRRGHRPAALPEWYWEPVEADVRLDVPVIALPVPESLLDRSGGASRTWDDLGAQGRERLLRDGLLVTPSKRAPPGATARMGAFYKYLRDERVPYLVTVDALSFSLHVALARALADVEETTIFPALSSLLATLETRLGAEQRGAGVEVGEALLVARGIVAVAHALLGGPASEAPPDLAAVVTQELLRIDAHAGPSTSPLLGVPIDYGQLAVPRGAGRPGAFRAMAWLAVAPLTLLGGSEAIGAQPSIGAARLHTRAAMVIARVLEREVSPVIHDAFSRIARYVGFVWGAADDLTPPALAEIAAAAEVSITDPKHITDVTRVDRVRWRAARTRAPRLFDGHGARIGGRAASSVRILGGHASPELVALSLLTRASVGDRGRALPSTLDLAVWLGAPEARAALHEVGADGSPGYDDALNRAAAARPDDASAERHASVHGSRLDVVMAWLEPPPAIALPGVRHPMIPSAAADRASIESALAAWTVAWSDGHPFTRPLPRPASRAARSPEIAVQGGTVAAFVEPEPELIARLVSTATQTKRGIAALGGLDPRGPSMVALAEVEDLLRVALRLATRQANDEPFTSEDQAALQALPARLVRLEDTRVDGEDSSIALPVSAEIFADPVGRRVLVSVAGLVEEAVAIVREPGSRKLLLAVGAHVPQYEVVEERGATSKAPRDPSKLTRPSYTATFRAP